MMHICIASGLSQVLSQEFYDSYIFNSLEDAMTDWEEEYLLQTQQITLCTANESRDSVV
jgi:hypothetical protein